MREFSSRSILLVTICTSLVVPPPRWQARARAQDAQGDSASMQPAEYERSIDSGVAEFQSGNYVEAREHFARAHSLAPNARTLRGLGMVEFELRNYVDAVSYLEAALGSTIKTLEGELRARTESLLERARAYVGTVHLDVAPLDAEVSVDGFPVPISGRAKLRLPVGDHVFEFRADGYGGQRRALKLRGEQTLTLSVRLARASAGPVTVSAASADRSPVSAPTPVYKRWWLWTTLGVVVAGGVVAAVLLTRETKPHEEPVLTANTPPNATIFPLGDR